MTKPESLEAVHTHTHTGNLITKILNIEKEAMYFSDA